LTSATRDLASHDLWERSLERSRRRRVLAEDARKTISRRRNASLAVSAAMATTPVIPSVIASSMSGARKDTKKTRTVTPDTGQRILLKAGAVSPSVATLQRRLGVPDDGYYGPVTQAAVKKFQKRHHLPVTGMVDVKTWLKLFPDGMVIYAPHAGVAQLSAQAPKAALRNASMQNSDSVASLNVSNQSSGASVQKASSTPKHTANADVLPAKGASHKAAAAASGAVSHHSSSSSGSGSSSGSAPRGNLSGASSMIAAMIAEANRIDSHHYAYSWGGGHNSSFSGPYDCSGAVSAVLHAAGLISRPMVSGEFMHWGAPGPGAVTLYANAGHVYMSILGHYFGTSYANPGGGAGWFAGGPRPGFVVVHVPFSSLHMSKRQLRHFLRMAAMQRASSGGSTSGGSSAGSDPAEQPRSTRFVRYQPVTPGYRGQAPGSESSDGGSGGSASSDGGSSAPSEPSSGVSSGGVSSGGSGYSGSSDQQQVSAASTSDQGQYSSGSSSGAGSSSGPSYSTNAASSSSEPSSSATESQSSASGGSYSSGAGSSGSGSSGSASSGSSSSSGSGSSASEPSHVVSRGSAGSGSGSGSGGSSHAVSSGSGSYGGGSGSSGSTPSVESSASQSQASGAASSAASSASSAGSGAADSAAGAASSPAGGGGGGGGGGESGSAGGGSGSSGQ